ncbi:MAG: hypothetical protein CMI13_04325 [Oleibacter sp.]|nr:hypothetical protein [Thalassolituus sp.]|tara:strand:- start:1405 stop:1695 length:291 start_codon:yes stop_codon:yes gene_type:complete
MFGDITRDDQRLVILRTLVDTNGTANDSILQKMLHRFGHHISRDLVKTHLAWLEENELVKLDHVMSTDVATITARGHDVATGSARVPGVGIPRPGA